MGSGLAFLRYPDARIVGLTATPERGDGCGLSACFDGIVVGATIKQLTDGGYLVPCEVLRPDKPLAPGEIAQNPVDAYVTHATGRQAVVFARSVALAESYSQEFAMRGIKAHAISAETPWPERRLWISAFRRGSVRVLVNVYVLTEGFDAPEASCCILARGCGSAGMYLQMVGRVLRPAPGKKDAVLIDLRGVSHEHGRPDDDRDFGLDGRGIRLKDANSYCPVCGAPRTPPDPCESCGYAPSGEDGSKPDRVVGMELKPYQRFREVDDNSKRAERLARWIADARVRGFKDGWWRAKYNAVYGVYPNAGVISEARKIL